MPDNRTDSLVQLAQDTARRITGSHTAWMAYLQTAARLYKYPYHEQLLIFAQRPQATACAGYEVWKNTMRRYVRRGAKGIALLDTSGDAPRLRYVFDVADTGELSQSRSLNLWKLSEENAQAVSLSLENGYDVPAREGLERQLRAISSQLAGACWVDRKQEIFDIVDGSFLEGYDEGAIGASFRRAASVSLEYALRSRCGLANEGRFIREDFIPVTEWNTPEAAAALGTAVSEMSGEVLRTIEISIRNHERSVEHDRLQAERRDPDSRPEAERNGGAAPWQVRADAQDVPANASDDAVEQPAAKRDIAGAPAGDRRGGTEPSGTADAGADEGRGRDGGIESQRPDAMGRPDERLQGAGRGNHPQGAGVQLSFLEGLAAQPGTERAESDFPSALSIPQEVVDEVLRVGGNTAHHRERIVAAFEKQKPVTGDFLRSLLHGGNGIVTDAGTFAAWYDETGIRISRGRSARHAPSARLVSWQEAAGRIGQLLEEGRFAANVELAGAEGYERFRLAEKLWYLRQDFSEKAIDAGYLSSLAKDMEGGFQEGTEWLAEKLTDPTFRTQLTREYRQFLSDQQQSGDLLRFHFHRLDEILEVLEDLDLPPRAFSSEMAEIPPVRQFITEDEIDANLAEGGLMSGSKGRIFAFFQQFYSDRERVDFLKQEYGTGGRSHALSNADGSDESHSGKGIRYQKRDCPEVRLTWQKVAGRIAGLIRQGLYLTEQEQAEYDRIQAEKVQAEKDAPQAPQPDPAVWEYNGVKERHPDDLVLYQMGDFFELYGEDAREAAPELGLQLVSRAIPGGGRVEMCGFPANRLNQYLEQLRARHDVTVSTASEGSAQRREYSVLSTGHEAEQDINAREAEYGADGFRVLRDEEAMQAATVRELHEQYKSIVREAVTQDAAYRNACGHSDYENAVIEGNAAIHRAVLGAGNMGLLRAYSDVPEFRQRLQREIIGETYPKFHELLHPISDDDIDRAIQDRNGKIESKHAVVRYMKEHGRENDAAAWLANEFDGGDGSTPFAIRPESPEGTNLPWPAVQRRIAQLITEERFFTQVEQDNFDDVDPTAIREALERRGIVGGQVADPERAKSDPFIQQVMADAEQASASPEEAPDGTGEAPFPYAVGDTVRLEDGKPFVIEEAGTFTIRLRDPSLAYPIIRAESRESFARLMERYPQTALSSAQNFRITDDDLGVGGAKTRYGWNVAAIRTLRALEAEGRPATLQEQETLSRYVGWGGIPQAFDAQNEDWRREYAELKALLSETEYASARASTLNAHYTSPTVIRAIYDAVEQMGFRTGNILEPAMGVGNFFGLLPESMVGSRLYGVELDSLTGRIARQLYPEADITVAGFETTDRRDFFDLAVGNVPFGNYQVNDKAYNHLRFNIHDYFFAKAIDQVRPGGIIAFVTSKGTMDKQSPDVRRFIAQRAELLGAIRLPNNAFARNANTEVTSDILFLQKRDRPITIEPDWVHLGQTGDGIPVNSYFAEHPEMILGRMAWDDSMYGGRKETACLPLEGADLASQLHEAVERLQGSYLEAEPPELGEGEAIRAAIPADPNVKNYTYTVVDEQVYYRENSLMVRPDLSAAAEARVRGMVSLRDCVQELIALQMDPATPDSAIRDQQAELNRLYDAYTAKYGLLNSRGNAQAFSDDSSYYLLCSLEILDEDGNLRRKADMFTRRTIRPAQAVDHVDNASEALALSIAEKAGVDMAYMEQLTGQTRDELASQLQGAIYRLPESAGDEPCYVTADEYLSGNIRSKIASARLAAEKDEAFQINVSALEKAMPKDLDASEIEVRLGATWIPPRYIQQFMLELLQPPIQARYRLRVAYSSATAEWQIENKSSVPAHNVAAYTTYGTGRASAYRILEDSLNLRDVRIYDTVQDADGKEKRVLNSKETTLAQQKQQAVKDAFRDWLWQDPTRRQELCARYNELFNATRPREYDGSHIRFSGMNPEITLRRHQRDAIAHILYGGNCLLAHEVGAGKTFEMVAACMESKRLGLCSKALFAVPNHLTEQWASEFLRLYPSANLLVASKKDFETKNRKKFCARIATGDYDAIILGHSQFEKIPISQERQERLLQEQIDEIEEGVKELRASHTERFTIKQLERMKRQLETRLQKFTSATRKDDVVTFEQLGVDRLYVDEAHNYKNLFLYTKMRNVAGLSTTDAQKSSDMYLKCRYMDELTGGRGIVFATGTPVSNSMTELYTMMRYLQHDLLTSRGFSHFDCWASTFGETVTAIELAPEGTGYRARTRFARFFNLPELMAMFREAADIKTADQLHLPTPEAVYHNVVAKPTEMQKDMVEALSKRAAEVHAGVVNPKEDNMLKITSDGRKLGLDQRILNPLLPDDEHSKVNQCVENILRIWREGESGKLTQLVFSDLSTPGGEGFTVYEDIRRKLIAAGVPEGEIAFIHDANTEVKKKELFAKVRAGQVRVLMGSTQKMGAGTNVQDRLAALHDLDCPWRPGDLEQRKGRIVRQGNRNDTVHIYRYVTENTFDAYLWQTIENKQKFISQIMTSKSPVRSCEDVDETALSYAEIKALCAGNPLIKEKMDLDIEVARLRLLKANHQSQRFQMEDRLLKYFPVELEKCRAQVGGFEADLETRNNHPLPSEGFVGMEVLGRAFSDKEDAGKAILEAVKTVVDMKSVRIGHYRGFEMSLELSAFGREYILTLRGRMAHFTTLGSDPRGNIQRIDNTLGSMESRLKTVQDQIATLQKEQEAAKEEIAKPFAQEDELREKSARLIELDSLLDIGKGGPEVMPEGGEPEAMEAAVPDAAQGTREPERKERSREEVR